MIDLEKYTIEELVELKNNVLSKITSFEDGYIYICHVHSYGRHWYEQKNNLYNVQELCYMYDGDHGIVDVYSNNPDISLENYGSVLFIESKKEFDDWCNYKQLKNTINIAEKELEDWNNRESLPFVDRPMFEPTFSQDELEEMKIKLSGYETSVKIPAEYSNTVNNL